MIKVENTLAFVAAQEGPLRSRVLVVVLGAVCPPVGHGTGGPAPT